ncbi:MAG: GlsB/YeaQ/YmgE family stress response membrane protein [Acidobacteriota bacterium]
MFHFLWMCLIGLIIGALAKLIMPGRDPGGIIVTMLLGIAGSLLGGYIGRAFGWYQAGQGAGFIMSLVGALVLLFIYRLIVRNRSTRTATRV